MESDIEQTFKEQDDGTYTSSRAYGGEDIKVTVDLDEDSKTDVFRLVQQVLSNLEKLDVQAKDIISNDMLETYNNGWNEYDEPQPDGSYKTIIRPTLKSDQFKHYFKLHSVNVTGCECVDLWYGESELFWGHSIYVSSFNGADFSEAHADMFG